MATFQELIDDIQVDLRDTNALTWSEAEIKSLLNLGIKHIESVYPKEIVKEYTWTNPSISNGLKSVDISTTTNTAGGDKFRSVYRIDVYGNTAGTRTQFLDSLRSGTGDGPDSGWETHGGVLYFAPGYTLPSPATLRVYGYGSYNICASGVSASAVSVDMDDDASNAVKIFVQSEALFRLVNDRATFQQWQVTSGATDVTPIGMNQLAFSSRQRWKDELRRIRRMRKVS
jgi:hypothetical protein